jgi:DNA polymerase-3 subunit alpha
MMAFLRFEDLYGSLDVIVFPKKYESCASMINEDAIVFIKARVSLREDEAPKLILENITPMEQVLDSQNGKKLYIKLQTGCESKWQEAKRILTAHSGEIPVCIFFEKTSEIKCTNRELWCDGSEALNAKLCALFGETCVKYK